MIDILILVGVWLGMGFCAYPLVRLTEHLFQKECCLSYDRSYEEWTNYNSLVWIIVCLAVGPIALSCFILFSFISFIAYKSSCIKKNRRENKDSWWGRKAKF